MQDTSVWAIGKFFSFSFMFITTTNYYLQVLILFKHMEGSSDKNGPKWCISRRLGHRWVLFLFPSYFLILNQIFIMHTGYKLRLWNTWCRWQQWGEWAQMTRLTLFGPLPPLSPPLQRTTTNKHPVTWQATPTTTTTANNTTKMAAVTAAVAAAVKAEAAVTVAAAERWPAWQQWWQRQQQQQHWQQQTRGMSHFKPLPVVFFKQVEVRTWIWMMISSRI